ncbi:hypothetical protein C0993_005360 [Termitomyces sp. T159_Od127]|nr:hypothetical protein C0993_005360 [Termitomyces sp. T159_Od127]
MDTQSSDVKLVLESVVPVPKLVEDLREMVKSQLDTILVPDNESQFEQENLAPVFKIMAYYIAYKQVQKQIGGAEPGYAAIFKLWSSPQFQKSDFQFFASSTLSKNHITDFAIYLCLPLADASSGLQSTVYEESFTVKANVEVKTNTVLTDSVFEEIMGWYEEDKRRFVPGMVIQYVWQTNKNVGGGRATKTHTLDKILRQVWNQMMQENVEYALLTTATSTYYLFRRRGAKSGDLYISPPYKTVNNLALYTCLAAVFELHDINSDMIITPNLNKDWWNNKGLPTFEATGIRPVQGYLSFIHNLHCAD